MVIGYLIISFLCFFLSWKKYSEEMKSGYCDAWINKEEFWIIVSFTFIWFISVPCRIAYITLDLAYNRFTTNKQDEENEKN